MRAHKGTVSIELSNKHLDSYVQEFAGRHILREQDSIEMMAAILQLPAFWASSCAIGS